jgi:hypothetical protein
VPCRLLLLLSSESTFARASKFDFGARRIFRLNRMVKERHGGSRWSRMRKKPVPTGFSG